MNVPVLVRLFGWFMLMSNPSAQAAPFTSDELVKFDGAGSLSVEEFLRTSQTVLAFPICYDPAEAQTQVFLQGPMEVPHDRYLVFFESVLRGTGFVHYVFGGDDNGPHLVRRRANLSEATLRNAARLVPATDLSGYADRQLWITTVIDLEGLDPEKAEEALSLFSGPDVAVLVLQEPDCVLLTGHASDVVRLDALTRILQADRSDPGKADPSPQDELVAAPQESKAPRTSRSAFQDLSKVLQSLQPLLEDENRSLQVTSLDVDGTRERPSLSMRGVVPHAKMLDEVLSLLNGCEIVVDTRLPKTAPRPQGDCEFSDLGLEIESAEPLGVHQERLASYKAGMPYSHVADSANNAGLDHATRLKFRPRKPVLHPQLGLSEQWFELDGTDRVEWFRLYAFLHNLDLDSGTQVARLRLTRDMKHSPGQGACLRESLWDWEVTLVCWKPLSTR